MTAWNDVDSLGINLESLNRIDQVVRNGMSNRAFPGCQVVVLKNGTTVYNRCFGTYSYEDSATVEPNTLYDIASLTKTTGTLLAVMKLYEEKKLGLSDSIAGFLPYLSGTDKQALTIADLLFHESGFPASLDCYRLVVEKKTPAADSHPSVTMNSNFYQFKTGWVSAQPSEQFPVRVSDSLYVAACFHDSALSLIARTKLLAKSYRYSCINFILLKEICERISGVPMDRYLDSLFYKPMGLRHITYQPRLSHPVGSIAPTLKRDFLRNGEIRGYVHDPDAAFLGGVSGNAGLFANAGDVAAIHQMLLNQGTWQGVRFLQESTCRVFTTTTSQSGRRGLGFNKPVPSDPKNSPCCPEAPAEVYGHTGYTGTCCWVDPVNKLVYVFLCNRTYPYDQNNKLVRMGIRTSIQEIIYQSLK
jgi:CubicO group peptidase (beta-lactamase class C family)